jgi:intracellular sulfur oxidation DsrE/DsrF family protein
MSEDRLHTASVARRWFLGRLGIGAGLVGATLAGSPAAVAQGAGSSWKPARHPQDDWFEAIPGKHRFVFDTTSPEGMQMALQFCANYFNANNQAYELKDDDLAVVIVARHKSTSFAYNDSMWAKYGQQLSAQSGFVDPKTNKPPSMNLYETADRGVVQDGRALNDLIKRGVQFAVCQTSSRGISGAIARAAGGDADKILQEISANLIANARIVPAGILAVNRAQERGYSFVYAI